MICLHSLEVINALITTTHPTHKEDDEIHKLFNTLDAKDTPLYQCSGGYDGIKWRVPKDLDCPFMPEKERSEVVSITLWWEDISKHPIQGYECYAIVTKATKTPCPSPDFYFDSGKSVVLLANKTITTNIDVLPKPGEGMDSTDLSLPLLSFKSPSVYSMEEMTSQETIMGMIREMGHQYRIDDAIQLSRKGSVLTPDVADTIAALRDAITSPVKSFIGGLFTTTFTLLLILLVIYVGYKYKTTLNTRLNNLVQRTRERLGGATVYQPATRQPEEYINRPLPAAPVYPLRDLATAQEEAALMSFTENRYSTIRRMSVPPQPE